MTPICFRFRALTLILTVFVVLWETPGQAQCCSSGNPFLGSAGQPALQSRVLTAALTYRYSRSSRFYHNDSPYRDLNFSQTARVNYAELQLAYGATRWLTVAGEFGYFFNKTLQTKGQDPMRGYGPGDLAIHMKFNLLSLPRSRLSITPSVGIKLPVGVFDQEVDHVKLPISVQPSSGGYRYLANLFISKGIGKISLAGFVSYEYSQLIESENFYYRYGDQWMTALYFNYRPWKRLTIDLQVRNEYRARSTREHDERIGSSGYDVVFFTPQVTCAFRHDWYLSAYGDIPLYKYYNGIQMSFGYAMNLTLSKSFDFIRIKARHGANAKNMQ